MTGHLDLNSSWGPFSQTYLGISHILNPAQGSMADLAVHVGRREPGSIILPDNTFDYTQDVEGGNRRAVTGARPESVAPDYSSYAIRYFLDAHGDTALAKFTVENEKRARCEITFENSSNESREYFCGLGLAAFDSRKRVRLKDALRPWWIPARDYVEIEAYQKAFALGCRQCLTRVFSWGVEAEVLAQAFGGWADDRVTYRTKLPAPLKDGHLYFRYVKYGELNHSWEIRINGKATTFHFPQTWAISGGGWGKNRDAYEEWRMLRVPVAVISESEVTVELRSLDAPGNDRARIWLDGMLFSEGRLPGDQGHESLVSTTLADAPLRESARVELQASTTSVASFEIVMEGDPHVDVTISAEGIPVQTTTGTGSYVAHVRRCEGLPPARLERDSTSGPWGAVEGGGIIVSPHSKKSISFLIAFGESSAFSAVESKSSRRLPPEAQGPYAEMMARLADTILFNVNYPLNLSGSPSPFYVPAKYFSIPYSWDGGFIAVGLATFAPDLAQQEACYFLADKQCDFPFLYCGSPVPTSFYALWDVYQATQDREALRGSYAGAKRMYDFFLGRTPGSAVNLHNDGLLSTYPYNYNLGIDDHPIQRWAEKEQLTRKGLYSIILMPQMLRIARIMRNIATLLGREEDAEQYRQDSELLADVIDTRMWDEKSGLYGWLYRSENGVEPVIFDDCAGDRSTCAFLPLFAGLATHKKRLIDQMMDPSRFLTRFGISTVDLESPSFNPNGYWNGGLWPVTHWFLWHGLLEAGEPALARQVCDLILKTWNDCFQEEHYFGEHFMLIPEQMNGTPNFGGLGAVLLPMYAAYYTPYQVTTCYDVILLKKSIDPSQDTLALTLAAPFLASEDFDLLINMGKAKTPYAFIINGQQHGNQVSDEYGHLCLRLPRPSAQYELLVKPLAGSPGKDTAIAQSKIR